MKNIVDSFLILTYSNLILIPEQRICVTVQLVKKSYPKALSDGYLQEVKRLASNKNIHQTGLFQA